MADKNTKTFLLTIIGAVFSCLVIIGGALTVYVQSLPEGPIVQPGPNDPPPVVIPPATGYDLTTHGALVEGYAGLFPSGSPLVGVAGGPIDLPNTEGITPYGLPRANDGVTGSGFCLNWEAALVPPANGLYQFRVATKPGGHVILDDSVAWSDSTQDNAWIWSYFERQLTKGKQYPISALCAASRSGGCGFQLRWRCKEAGIHGTITDESDVAGYASEKGYSDIDTFYLRPPANWKSRVKTYVPPPIVVVPPTPSDLLLPPLIGADYETPDLPADFMQAKLFEPWREDISAKPVDPKSAAYIASLGSFHLHPGFGQGNNGIPIQAVPEGTATIPVAFDVADESDAGPWPVPMPPTVEGGGDPAQGDVHWTGFSVETKTIFDIYQLHQKKSDQKWYGYQGTRWDLDKPWDQRPAGWTSADAAGLPILPGLVRYQEVAAGEINHAIRCTVGRTQKGYCGYGRHWASTSSDENLLPMGAILRLKASVDLSSFPAETQVILKAAKKYGFVVADNGSAGVLFIIGTPDRRWPDDKLGAMKTLRQDSFEVVETGPINR